MLKVLQLPTLNGPSIRWSPVNPGGFFMEVSRVAGNPQLSSYCDHYRRINNRGQTKTEKHGTVQDMVETHAQLHFWRKYGSSASDGFSKKSKNAQLAQLWSKCAAWIACGGFSMLQIYRYGICLVISQLKSHGMTTQFSHITTIKKLDLFLDFRRNTWSLIRWSKSLVDTRALFDPHLYSPGHKASHDDHSKGGRHLCKQ